MSGESCPIAGAPLLLLSPPDAEFMTWIRDYTGSDGSISERDHKILSAQIRRKTPENRSAGQSSVGKALPGGNWKPIEGCGFQRW
jgi:hypothetical protein